MSLLPWNNLFRPTPPPDLVDVAYRRAAPAIQDRIDQLSADPSSSARFQDAMETQQKLQFAQRTLSFNPMQMAMAWQNVEAMARTDPAMRDALRTNRDGFQMIIHSELAGVSIDQLRESLAELGARQALSHNVAGTEFYSQALMRLESADRVVTAHERAARSVPSAVRQKEKIEPVGSETAAGTRDLGGLIREFMETLEQRYGASPERAEPKKAEPKKAEQKQTEPPKSEPLRQAKKPRSEPKEAPVSAAASEASAGPSLKGRSATAHVAGILVRYQTEPGLAPRKLLIGKDGGLALELTPGVSQKVDYRGARIRTEGMQLWVNGEKLDLRGLDDSAPAAKPKPKPKETEPEYLKVSDYRALVTEQGVDPTHFNDGNVALLNLRKDNQTLVTVLIPNEPGRSSAAQAYQRLARYETDGVLDGIVLGPKDLRRSTAAQQRAPLGFVKATFDLTEQPPLAKFERIDQV